jgi:hypothetical protein
MKKIYIALALIAVSLKSYSVGFDASYNITIVPFISFCNVQLAAKDIVGGFGLYASIRGLGNGVDINGSKEINDVLLSMQKSSDEFTISYSDGEMLRSGASFGISKQLGFLFVSAAAGYCDIVERQKTTIHSSSSNTSKSFIDQNGVNREFEWEAMFGVAPEYKDFYIPVYFGWSYNYRAFLGIGVGYNF